MSNFTQLYVVPSREIVFLAIADQTDFFSIAPLVQKTPITILLPLPFSWGSTVTQFGRRALGDLLCHPVQSLVWLSHIPLILSPPRLLPYPRYNRPIALYNPQSVLLVLSHYHLRGVDWVPHIPFWSSLFHSHSCWPSPPHWSHAMATAPCSTASISLISVLCRHTSLGKLAQGDAPSYSHISTIGISSFTHAIFTVVPLAFPVRA